MNRSNSGPIEGFEVSVQAPGEVDILRVHEKAGVEQAGLGQSAATQEHETALNIGHIEALPAVDKPEGIAPVSFSE